MLGREIRCGTLLLWSWGETASGLTSNWNSRPSRKKRSGMAQAGLAHCEVTVETQIRATAGYLYLMENDAQGIG
jgi:hypothetical protein